MISRLFLILCLSIPMVQARGVSLENYDLSSRVPTLGELESLKLNFAKLSDRRVQRIFNIEDTVNQRIEKVLEIGQAQERRIGENNFSELYLKIGSSLQSKLSDLRMIKSRLLVSKNSPAIDKIQELQDMIQSFSIEMNYQKSFKKKEKLRLSLRESYKDFVLGNDFLMTMKEVRKVVNDFSLSHRDMKRSDLVAAQKLIQTEIPLSDFINVKNCNYKMRQELKGLLGFISLGKEQKDQNQLDLISDSPWVEFVLNGPINKGPLVVKCQGKKLKNKRGFTYRKKSHQLLIGRNFKGPREIRNKLKKRYSRR